MVGPPNSCDHDFGGNIQTSWSHHKRGIEKQGMSWCHIYPGPQFTCVIIPEQPLFQLPKHAFIYGIAYDAFGFIIYSFFPKVISTDTNGCPNKWGYGCMTADSDHAAVFENKQPKERLKAIQALLVVQQHAIMLSKELQNVPI